MEQSTIALIIIAITVVLMVTEKIPLAATILLSAIAMSITGIQKLTQSYFYFGSTTIAFLVGMMVVGDALFENGVAQLIGDKLFKSRFVQKERSLLFVVVLAVGIMSGFTSNSAIVAMMIPLIGSVALKSNGTIKQKNLLLGVGVAAAVGGGLTLSGSTSQLVAQGILESSGVQQMTYFEMGKVGFFLILITAVYFATIGYEIQKRVLDFDDVFSEDIINHKDDKVFSPWKRTFTGLVTLWILSFFLLGIWNIGFVSMVGATILVTTKCIDLRRAMRNVDWNTVLILGAAQAMANGLNVSGGGKVIADWSLNLFGGEAASSFVIMAVVTTVCIVLTNVMSNTACTAMLTPICVGLAASMGVNHLYYVIPMVIASQCAVATPIGTPCMTQVLVGGYRFKDYMKVGMPLMIILLAAIILLTPVMYGSYTTAVVAAPAP